MASFLGFQAATSSTEKLVSGFGAGISIFFIASISYFYVGSEGVVYILPSMGAAAVLLFAVPHGPLSQPWALFAGNILSAVVGVTCAQWITNDFIAAAVAVGAAIALMHICRCLHPPGGATALAAVIGGATIRDLGYGYVVFPTLINCIVIFSVAMVFNNLFAWRSYPLSRLRYRTHSSQQASVYQERVAHIQEVLADMGAVVDVSAEQINYIFEQLQDKKAFQGEEKTQLTLEVGQYYANGEAGFSWSVRQIENIAEHENEDFHLVVYRVVEGVNKHRSDSCTFTEFKRWAKVRLESTVE